MPDFIFVRHGKSQANESGVIADGTSPLVEEGFEQARKTAQEVKGLGIIAIACSPYLRAQQTAEVIARELGANTAHIHVIDELRERSMGELEGKPKSHDSEWYFESDDAEGIEPRDKLAMRMRMALQRIGELAEKEGLILVVGHAVSGFYLQQIAKGKTQFADFDPPLQMSNADFARVAFIWNSDAKDRGRFTSASISIDRA